jgi:hypothetical protein
MRGGPFAGKLSQPIVFLGNSQHSTAGETEQVFGISVRLPSPHSPIFARIESEVRMYRVPRPKVRFYRWVSRRPPRKSISIGSNFKQILCAGAALASKRRSSVS